jgi:hypothetical protein
MEDVLMVGTKEVARLVRQALKERLSGAGKGDDLESSRRD